MELGEHDITFLPRNVMKGQVLADFIVEMPNVQREDIAPKGVERLTTMIKRKEESLWMLFVYGASGMEGAEAGLLQIDLDGMKKRTPYFSISQHQTIKLSMKPW